MILARLLFLPELDRLASVREQSSQSGGYESFAPAVYLEWQHRPKISSNWPPISIGARALAPGAGLNWFSESVLLLNSLTHSV
ncbi:MAG: hypothetical protein DMG57_05260 [Acidobacteria bacterium]|nr:MAG: hypothetical protein DMG57_05260 [Acidobacteriota bacterium]